MQDETLNANLNQWLERLNDKQREVIARRYGLHGYDQSTLEDVAREMGVTRERVRQIQIEALRRLREIMETEGFSAEALFS
ncbi:sigma-70 family RNA polymerase sigma factor [Methylogaea oryzae]|uniref:sigma-70 family RNA polymerase sigma factor n=1 Tax=Methylogaea oryzae TaxID=1295382 RepID=UPI00278C42B6|nr:sigma-70 family RNA polymerase sigma factor [Methylogaea oryzae]